MFRWPKRIIQFETFSELFRILHVEHENYSEIAFKTHTNGHEKLNEFFNLLNITEFSTVPTEYYNLGILDYYICYIYYYYCTFIYEWHEWSMWQ